MSSAQAWGGHLLRASLTEEKSILTLTPPQQPWELLVWATRAGKTHENSDAWHAFPNPPGTNLPRLLWLSTCPLPLWQASEALTAPRSPWPCTVVYRAWYILGARAETTQGKGGIDHEGGDMASRRTSNKVRKETILDPPGPGPQLRDVCRRDQRKEAKWEDTRGRGVPRRYQANKGSRWGLQGFLLVPTLHSLRPPCAVGD